MRRMLLVVLMFLIAGAFIPVGTASADGCYICTRGSACGQYCRYSGKDTWANRKKCKKAGCRIGGTASCPSGVNIKVCTGSLIRHSPWRYAQRHSRN